MKKPDEPEPIGINGLHVLQISHEQLVQWAVEGIHRHTGWEVSRVEGKPQVRVTDEHWCVPAKIEAFVRISDK